MATAPRIPPEALRFLRRLARHNTRAWFEAHRTEYQQFVQAPVRALIEEMDVRLARIAPEFTGDPRRSAMRIHRDTRFSRDKRPYNTFAGIRFFHIDAGPSAGMEYEGASAGLYLQLGAEGHLSAGGLWMPPATQLARVRQAIADDPAALASLVHAPGFRRRFGALSDEAMLVRAPRGFAADHPAARWLRYRSFTASRPLTDAQVTSPRLPALLERDFLALLPLVRWLNAALGRPAHASRR